MNVVISTCAGQVNFDNTQLVVRHAGVWPSSLIRREAGHRALSPVTSLATNHVHFDVQNPTAYSIVLMVKGSQDFLR